jgi:hypothetical protein
MNILLIIFIVLIILSLFFLIYKIDYTKRMSLIPLKKADINLPLNRYPWLGSHDAATGYDSRKDVSAFLKLKFFPFLSTQNLNFYNQYLYGGARLFDLRVGIPKKEMLFYHGKFSIQKVSKDESFLKLIKKAIEDKEIIVLWFNHYEDKNTESQIKNYIKNYLTDKNITNYTFLKNFDDLEKSYKYYLDNQKYILLLTDQKLIRDNWNEKITCFDNPNEKNCLKDKNNQHWKSLYNYIDDTYKTYNTFKPKPFFVIQTMFQAPYSKKGLMKATLGTRSFANQMTETEKKGKVNLTLTSYFNDKKYKPNIVLVDNISDDSKKLINQIIDNFNKDHNHSRYQV